MKKIVLSAFALCLGLLASAQSQTLESYKSLISNNANPEEQSEYCSEVISYHLKGNSMEELEGYSESIKEINPKAYSRFCWELTYYHLGKQNEGKYEYYAGIMNELHPDDAYIQDGLVFNKVSLHLSQLDLFFEPNEIAQEDKAALFKLATSPTFFGNMACELIYEYFDERPCDSEQGSQENSTISLTENASVSDPKISIFPNPSASGIFSLEVNGFAEEKEIQVVNTLGVTVSKQTTKEINLNFDISNFSKGIYFVKISDGELSKTERVLFQ